MAIRILHVIDSLETGGLENGVIKLIQRMDADRFEHAICAVRGLGPLIEHVPLERVKVTCLDKGGQGFSFQTGALARTIQQIRPHIVHSRNWGAIEAVLAGWYVKSCALVHSEHGLESVDSGQEPLRRRWFRRLAFELAGEVFAVSHQLRDFHCRRTGFPAGKMTVIHNGVNTEHFRPRTDARSRCRQRLGIGPDELCIGAVGRLEPVKDILTLLRAAVKLPCTGGRWRLVIAGAGSERPALEQFAGSQPELRGRVGFLGEIQDVGELFNAMDVYVLPSLSEGISNSLLESMATGLPVIASATGGNPEVVVDGESGLLFPVADIRALSECLELLREQPESRMRLGHHAIRRVNEHFSLESMIARYEQLYSGLLRRQPTARTAA